MEPRPGPPLCVWALASDALVWGTITAVRLYSKPSWRMHWERSDCGEPAALSQSLVETCDGPVWPGLELDLNVESVLHGTPPAQLTVRLGYERTKSLHPPPLADPDAPDGIAWPCDQGCVASGGAALRTGGTLGINAFFLAEHDVWTPVTDHLFDFVSGSDGVDVAWAQGGLERRRAPAGGARRTDAGGARSRSGEL
jgi:hypothetical protein